MKIAIIILLIIGMLEWTINGTRYPLIRTLFNLAALICFLIYSH